jgi:hypothetical protein
MVGEAPRLLIIDEAPGPIEWEKATAAIDQATSEGRILVRACHGSGKTLTTAFVMAERLRPEIGEDAYQALVRYLRDAFYGTYEWPTLTEIPALAAKLTAALNAQPAPVVKKDARDKRDRDRRRAKYGPLA